MHHIKPLLLAVTAILSMSITSACTAQSGSDVGDLEAEVEALKEEVATLRKELDEVLALAPIQSLIQENRPINITMSVEEVPTIGANDAKVTVVEFSDFQCPYCGRHVTQTYPALKQQYIDSGQLKYAFFDFPLGNHKLAPKASEAAHCAGEQGKFWEMHDELFENQRALQPEQLPGYAANAGVADAAAFQECLDSGRYSDHIEFAMQEGTKLRVRGTPTFGVGYTEDGGKSVRIVKVLRGALPLNQFQAVIDELLEADPSTGGTN
jgi:protein-disulfide isomerase